MNKLLLLSLSVISLSHFIACKEDKKVSKFINNTDSTTQKKDSSSILSTTITNEKSTTTQIPIFKDGEVQQYVTDYNAYVKEYLAAIEAKDIPKLTSLGQKAQEWTVKGQSISQKLASDPNELKKYNDYIQKLAEELQAAITNK